MTFDKVREYISRIPDIDHGGCGVAAYAMYLWLKKNNQLCEDFKFVLLYSGWMDSEIADNNAYVLEHKRGDLCVPGHIAICIDKIIIDSRDVISPREYNVVQFTDEPCFISSMINNGGWNPMFDRAYVKDIEKVLDISINEKSEDKTLFDKACIFFNKLYSDF